MIVPIFREKKAIKHLIVIEGPTASGKTSLSISLAKHFNTCVVSADSRQFYKELSIGTAKPTTEEQSGVPHHFIDSHSITEELSSAQFEKLGLELLEKEFKSKDVVLLTGGSGMFIDALCVGLDPIPSSETMKAQIQKEYNKSGLDPLLHELEKNDPQYFNEVDRNNALRVIRAIEVTRLTDKPFSSFRKSKPSSRPFKIHRYVINHNRESLYQRINQRVDEMMNAGLLDEVKSVVQYRHLTSMNTVGYKELFNYLDGKTSLEKAVEEIKKNTRRYAKRQLTWFRRHPDAVWIDYKSPKDLENTIIKHFESNHLSL